MAAASVVLGLVMVATVDYRVAIGLTAAGLALWCWSRAGGSRTSL